MEDSRYFLVTSEQSLSIKDSTPYSIGIHKTVTLHRLFVFEYVNNLLNVALYVMLSRNQNFQAVPATGTGGRSGL